MSGVPVGLIVCSDRAAGGQRADQSEAALRALLASAGHRLAEVRVVPDEIAAIEAALRELAPRCTLLLTSGGTGIGPRDCAVEATRKVLDRELPGVGEAMRRRGQQETPMAILSRATAGTFGRSLVVNLPGSPRGAEECLEVVLPVLGHATRLLQGTVRDCQEDLSS